MDHLETSPEQLVSNEVLDALRQEPLRNVVLFKLLHPSPDGSVVRQVRHEDNVATLLLLDHQFSRFDREAYPEAEASAVISSGHPELTRKLMAFVPRRQNLVFKLASDADRLVIAEEFPLERRTAYLSYTASQPAANDPRVKIRVNVAEAPFHIFAAQGHRAEWLGALLENGRAFTCAIDEGDGALSGCFAFQIDGAVWEVGGVYTRPDERGKRLAFRVVQSALGELARRGYVPRYQVEEGNTASIKLAETLGMTRYLTLTHYFSSGSGV